MIFTLSEIKTRTPKHKLKRTVVVQRMVIELVKTEFEILEIGRRVGNKFHNLDILLTKLNIESFVLIKIFLMFLSFHVGTSSLNASRLRGRTENANITR